MKPPRKEPRPERREDGKGASRSRAEREREYDKTLADSFPASDPPAAPSIIGPSDQPAPSRDKRP